MTISIRPLIEKDIPDAVALQAIPWPSKDNARLAENDMRGGLTMTPDGYGVNFIVALTPEQRIIGMGAWAAVSFASNMYALSWAVVHPDYRRKGINTLILDDRLQRIRLYNKAPAYDVIVHTGDNPLYRSRGFVPGFEDVLNDEERKCLMVAHFSGAAFAAKGME